MTTELGNPISFWFSEASVKTKFAQQSSLFIVVVVVVNVVNVAAWSSVSNQDRGQAEKKQMREK